MASLVLATEYTFHRLGFSLLPPCQCYRVGQHLADGSCRQVDQPDRGHDTQDEDNGDEVDLPANGPLNLKCNDSGIHAHVNGSGHPGEDRAADSGHPGEDRAADFHEIPHPRQLPFHGGSVARVRVENHLRNSRYSCTAGIEVS